MTPIAVTGVGLVWIKATPEAVMSQLDTFPTYKEWMPNVEETKVVKREGKRVDVFFKLSILGNEVHYTTIHEIDKENNVIRFRCDDSAPKKNVEDFTGAWVLKPFEGGTILAYTLDLNTGMAVPGFIQKWLSNAGLKKTVKAVKEQVEGK